MNRVTTIVGNKIKVALFSSCIDIFVTDPHDYYNLKNSKSTFSIK